MRGLLPGQPPPILGLLVLTILAPAIAAPASSSVDEWHETYNTSDLAFPETGCYYQYRHYNEGDKVYIHSYEDKQRAGSRFYIHARNIAAAVLFLLNGKGEIGQKYNITGEREVDNLELANFIADTLGKDLNYEMVNHHADRPGHDLQIGRASCRERV